MSILDAIQKLDNLVDDSDPDFESSQILHAYQTAESLRKKYPNYDWIHLVGLIHDLGKVLLLPEFEPVAIYIFCSDRQHLLQQAS